MLLIKSQVSKKGAPKVQAFIPCPKVYLKFQKYSYFQSLYIFLSMSEIILFHLQAY